MAVLVNTKERFTFQPTAPLGRDFVSRKRSGCPVYCTFVPEQRSGKFLPAGIFDGHETPAYLLANVIRPFDPLSLIIAGDVESNPGPTNSQNQREPCNICGKPTRNNPMVCATTGCANKSHKSCSGVSRYRANPEWHCHDHKVSVASNTPLPPPCTSVLERQKCCALGKILGRE